MPRISKYIPSMFHRRLLLLGVIVIFVFTLMIVRLGWMTLGTNGQESRAQASKRLVSQTWLPTVRGSIFDRKGRVLAGDRASYDIALDYRILAGQWVYNDRHGKNYAMSIDRYARRLANRNNKDIWDKLEPDQQDEIAAKFAIALQSRIDSMYLYISQQTQTPLQDLYSQRDQIVARVSKMKAEYTDRTRKRLLEEYQARGRTPSESDLKRIERIAAQPIAEEVAAHSLVPDVSDDIGFAFIRKQAIRTPLVATDSDNQLDLQITGESILPGLSVIDATTRMYPYRDIDVQIDRSSFPPPLASDSVATVTETDIGSMILGNVRAGVQATDSARRAEALEKDAMLAARSKTNNTDRGQYMYNDQIGRSGIERTYEDHLRGLRGVSIENKQTGESLETPSTPGLNIHLTLDIMLQARVRAILDPQLGLTRVQPWHHNKEPTTPVGTPLDAGVIVLEVATGDILALVSTPVPPSDGDWSRYGVRSNADQRRYDKIHTPYINRAIGMPYPPGSVAKAVILNGAAKYGVYEEGERIKATGYLLKDHPFKFRSWAWKEYGYTHAELLGREPNDIDALMVSSNVFFFTLGRRLQAQGVTKTYKDFGVGERYNLGVGYEWPGSIGRFNGPGDGSDLSLDEATLMGIGQGPVTWTPLHAADAFATIARQGFRIKPKLIQDGRAPQVTDINLLAWSVRDALAGLHEVVTNVEFGTGRALKYEESGPQIPIFNAPGIQVWGKTGTATAPDIMYDPDLINDTNGPLEPIIVRRGDHSWFVTLVGRQGGNPEYAIAVVVDYAGSGGRVSGPINNQIIHALIDEGYLPDSDDPSNPPEGYEP